MPYGKPPPKKPTWKAGWKPAVPATAAAAPPARRRRWVVWTRRVAILVALLFAIGVGAFTWIAYWPLEGGYAESLERLVPADVDFLYRGSWKELKDTGWVQRNVFDHPLHSSLDPAEHEKALNGIGEMEDRVNGSLPGALKFAMGVAYGTKSFGVEKDLFPGEVVAAGRFCGGTNPWKDGPPRWREILLLTKVTGPVKFALAALKREFVREMAVPPDTGVLEEASEGSGLYRVEMRNVVPSDLRTRSGCEGGHVVPPENVWFVGRVRDVLVLSNSEDLADKALALGRGEDVEQAVESRRGWQPHPVAGGISASVDLVPLRSYLNRIVTVEGGATGPGPKAGIGEAALGSFLSRFLTVDSLSGLFAEVSSEGVDGLRATASLSYEPQALHPVVQDTYKLDPTPIAEGIALRVPEQDTFAVAHMRTAPRALFQAVWETLKPADRRLVEDQVRRIGRYKVMAAFLDELAGVLGSETGVAFARLPAVFDAVKYETWFNDDPAPIVATAVMLQIAPGKTQEDVDGFLADRVQALGFDPPIREVVDQVPVSRLEMTLKSRDYEKYAPAYAAFNGYLILSTDFDYLKAILATMRGEAPSVAASVDFRSVLHGLPDTATFGLYVNADEARKVLWDQRNDWVQRTKSTDKFANEVRVRLQRDAAARGGPMNLGQINEQVDAEVDRYRAENYARFVEEYRGIVDDTDRFAAFAVVLRSVHRANAVLSGDLEGGAAVLFQGGETPPR